MRLSRFASWFLLVLAVFMVLEWLILATNLAPGHPRSFYVVHGVLIVVNVALAIAVGAIGWRGLRGTRRVRGVGEWRGLRGRYGPYRRGGGDHPRE
jgi:hypothetical protein